eukprot:CAMPEP_0113453506 /NCGR_PEP_ID=MMETSP0014_2-20120614/7390_1 /TAXON_ID=2857 /ORGANISM="Nitzschia sp." /LENGTH=147 /DNA_ID=CAMNT_0000344897 /DNA_START=109 /DNA_END=552 /DNA_ORIENTATION=+ /assembly_acc=CAM_ASM_000159
MSSEGNIFFTAENLAFSLPLLAVCGVYAYFKYVPLKYGLPILAVLFLIVQIRSQIQTQREKKIENMDDKQINDLALELEDEDNEKDKAAKDEAAKKLQKKKNAIATRLEHEKRREEKAAKKKQGKKKGGAADDDDDVDMTMFAKKKK